MSLIKNPYRKEEFDKLNKIISENSDKLYDTLTDAQLELYEKIRVSKLKVLDILMEEKYEEGFIEGSEMTEKILKRLQNDNQNNYPFFKEK